MSDVEHVALWVGLLSSVVSIVLSIVAILFTVAVDRRGREVSAQTTQSLLKIEGTVERVSADTAGLIKAAWDKLLGNMDRQAAPASELSAKDIALGVAAELRAEESSRLKDQGASGPSQALARRDFEEIMKSMEKSLVASLRYPANQRPGEAFDRAVSVLGAMPPITRAFVRAISFHHITLAEIRRLRETPLAIVFLELREAGLLIPVTHHGKDGHEEPCYYFPGGIARVLDGALALLPKIPDDVQAHVDSQLKAVGYPSEHPEHWKGPAANTPTERLNA